MLEALEGLIRGKEAMLKAKEELQEQITHQLDSLGNKVVLLEQVESYFQDVIIHKSTYIVTKIEDIVTKGLKAVFGDVDIGCVISTKEKNNKVEFRLEISHNGVLGIGEAHAGGVLAITSTLLRIIINLLIKNRPFIVLDETLLPVSRHYQKRLYEFLSELTKELDFTIVVIQPIKQEIMFKEFFDHIYLVEKDLHTKIREVTDEYPDKLDRDFKAYWSDA